jgi:hypothetical protein
MDGDVSRTSPVGSDQEYTRRRFLKTAAWGAAAISAAGIAGCANGGEEQGKAGEAKKNAQGDHQGVGGTSVSEARAAIVLSSNPLCDGFGQRGLFHAYYGGADFGEVTTTAGRIGDSTSAEDWYREWVATADRVAGIGDESAAAGHRLKGLVGELFAFAYRRGAGKHQVDGVCALSCTTLTSTPSGSCVSSSCSTVALGSASSLWRKSSSSMLLCTRVRSISARVPPPADAWLMALSPSALASYPLLRRRVLATRRRKGLRAPRSLWPWLRTTLGDSSPRNNSSFATRFAPASSSV